MISSKRDNNSDKLFDQQELREQESQKQFENYIAKKKFQLGSNIIYYGLAVILGCIIFSIIWPENIFIDNALGAIILIVMTVLGYIFGSDSKS